MYITDKRLQPLKFLFFFYTILQKEPLSYERLVCDDIFRAQQFFSPEKGTKSKREKKA